ncbi:hypothetical protein ACWD0Z_11515 [Streptomyces sp. NPDC003007]
MSTPAAPHHGAELDPFSLTWTALRAAVTDLSGEDFGRRTHLDLIAHLPDARQPPAEGLARFREMLERVAGSVPGHLPRGGRAADRRRWAGVHRAERAGPVALASKVPLHLG